MAKLLMVTFLNELDELTGTTKLDETDENSYTSFELRGTDQQQVVNSNFALIN